MARFKELSVEEVGDLFVCAHQVAPVISREFGGTSMTISIQVPDWVYRFQHMWPQLEGPPPNQDNLYSLVSMVAGWARCWSDCGTCSCPLDTTETRGFPEER